jgi:preprotein translocase subunit SecY
VNYARRQVGNKVYGGQSSLAAEAEHGRCDSSHLRFVHHPAARNGGELVQCRESMRWLKDIAGALTPGQPHLCDASYAAAIISSASSTPPWFSTAGKLRTT